MMQKEEEPLPQNPTPEPTTETGIKRRALKLGLLASLFALVGRATARAQDALTIAPDGATIYAKYINFGTRFGALLKLHDPGYELGIQTATIYARSGKSFAWYQGGSYAPTELDPGTGGTTMMSLTDSMLTVSGKLVGKGDATVEKGLTVAGAFVGNGDATLAKSVTIAGGVATQKPAGANTLDVQRAERTNFAGTGWKGDHPTDLALYVTATSGGADKLVEFRHSNGSQGIGFGHNTIYATGPHPDQALRLKARGTGRVEIEQEGWKVVGVAGAPAFQNGWVNYSEGTDRAYNTAAYFKDSLGIVHLRGLVKKEANGVKVDGQTIFTLPAGYRPESRELHIVCTSNPMYEHKWSDTDYGRLDVTKEGDVIVMSAGNAFRIHDSNHDYTGPSQWISLDGTTFRAAG